MTLIMTLAKCTCIIIIGTSFLRGTSVAQVDTRSQKTLIWRLRKYGAQCDFLFLPWTCCPISCIVKLCAQRMLGNNIMVSSESQRNHLQYNDGFAKYHVTWFNRAFFASVYNTLLSALYGYNIKEVPVRLTHWEQHYWCIPKQHNFSFTLTCTSWKEKTHSVIF